MWRAWTTRPTPPAPRTRCTRYLPPRTSPTSTGLFLGFGIERRQHTSKSCHTRARRALSLTEATTMLTLFREGGFSMFFIVGFGLVALGWAGWHAATGKKRPLGFVRG